VLGEITTPPSNPDKPALDPENPAFVSVWQNFYYRTDYIGNTDVAGANNRVLADPPTRTYVVSQPRPSIGTHTGYWTDPAVWVGIENLVWPLPAPVVPGQRNDDASQPVERGQQ
jgi:hypothetical protein